MVRKLYEYFRQFFIKSMKYVKYYIMLVYMDPKISRDINLYGLLIWLVLFWILIPFKLVKQYPIVLVGYVYTIFILLTNYLLIGNYLPSLERYNEKVIEEKTNSEKN